MNRRLDTGAGQPWAAGRWGSVSRWRLAVSVSAGASRGPRALCRRRNPPPHAGSARLRGMPELITRMVPILEVEDPPAERDFYLAFGFTTTYEGPEYPGFLAVGNGVVEFGLRPRSSGAPPLSGLTWQLGISDADEAIAICQRNGFAHTVQVESPRPDWTYRVVTVTSPGGMEILLEEERTQ